jgi:hypothetical protein
LLAGRLSDASSALDLVEKAHDFADAPESLRVLWCRNLTWLDALKGNTPTQSPRPVHGILSSLLMEWVQSAEAWRDRGEIRPNSVGSSFQSSPVFRSEAWQPLDR